MDEQDEQDIGGEDAYGKPKILMIRLENPTILMENATILMEGPTKPNDPYEEPTILMVPRVLAGGLVVAWVFGTTGGVDGGTGGGAATIRGCARDGGGHPLGRGGDRVWRGREVGEIGEHGFFSLWRELYTNIIYVDGVVSRGMWGN
jgi:hypothetical protein